MFAMKSVVRGGLLTVAAITLLAQGAWAAGCDKAAEVSNITIMGDWLPWALQGPMFDAIRPTVETHRGEGSKSFAREMPR